MLGLRLLELMSDTEPLDDVIAEVSQNAKKRRLMPEILEALLADES